MDVSGFKRVPHATLFGSGSYLANPRDRNGTTSIAYNISPLAVPPINAGWHVVQFRARSVHGAPWRRGADRQVRGSPVHWRGVWKGCRATTCSARVTASAGLASRCSSSPERATPGAATSTPSRSRSGTTAIASPTRIRGTKATRRSRSTSCWRPTATGSAAPPNPMRRSLPAQRARAVNVGSGLKPFTLKTLDGASEDTAERARQGDAGRLLLSNLPVLQRRGAGNPAALRHLQGAGPVGRLHQHHPQRGEARAWMARGASLHGAGAGGGQANDVQRDYAVEATPTHYLLDARGQVLSKHSGYQPGDALVLEQEIRNALTTVGSSQ